MKLLGVGLGGLLVGCSVSTLGMPSEGSSEAETSSDTGADATDGQVGEGSSSGEAPDDPTADATGEPNDPGDGPWDAGYALPEAPQVPGDPEAGYQALLGEGYISCGIPSSLFDLARPFLGGFADGPPLPGRAGKNADMPYNWTIFTASSGAELATVNCLECHAGYFDGELIVGLGRADYDSTQPLGEMLELVPSPELPIPGLEEMARWMNRLRTLAPSQRAPVVGVNHAVSSAVALVAHRDPQTLAWSDEELLAYPRYVIPVDTPPWWRVGRKNALFYNAMARGDHRGTMVLASSLCTDDVAELEGIMSYFNDIRAFIASIEAPTYPFEIDEELAAAGRDVYLASCAGCHGIDDDYPNLMFPLEVIGTDPLMAERAAAMPEFAEWFENSPYGGYTTVVTDEPFPGYIAPPLDGIWATAPFLHNGSVPTLELLLDSSRRPTYWRRDDYDSSNFDEDAVGWPHSDLDLEWAGGADGLPPADAKHVYDATRLGYWNGGHTFGDALSEDERRAVIEFLKTR